MVIVRKITIFANFLPKTSNIFEISFAMLKLDADFAG